MNHLIGVYIIKNKIIHDFSILSPINPLIIRLPIGITSKMRCSPKENKPTHLPANKEAMFPKGNEPIPQQNLPINKAAMFPKGKRA